MIFFKSTSNGEVFAYETLEDRNKCGSSDLVPMTPAEVEAHIKAASAPVFPRFYGNEKLDLFTPEEQLAVVTATMTDPLVKLMYDRLLGAAYLTYEDPEAEQGFALLVDKGLLTPERKAEIVAAMQPK